MKIGTLKVMLALAATLVAAPAMMLGQQLQNKQSGQAGKQTTQQASQPSDQVAPTAAPLNQNPEGLLPVLPMGPQPRPNGSPNYTSQYLDQAIHQNIPQQLPFYRSMSENLAGGNTSNPSANVLANGALNGVAQRGVQGSKNARGLFTQQSNHPNNQHGTGQHANPGEGQGQSP